MPATKEIPTRVKCLRRSGSLFKSSPGVRKVVIAYLHNKLSIGKEDEDMKVFRDREKLGSIIKQLMPPVPSEELRSEVENTIDKFDAQFVMEEREFSSKILMDNSIWQCAGETVVKELIYVDCMQQEMSGEDSYLSSACLSKLEASLAEDSSPILKLSKTELLVAHALIAALNGLQPLPDKLRSLDDRAFAFLFHADRDCIDCYGAPTLINYISSRIAGGGLTTNSSH